MKKHLIADFGNIENNDATLKDILASSSNKPYAREPVIALMNNKTLVCVFLTGGVTEPANNNFVVMKKSYYCGKTWTEAEV